jgi:hypothetical protein
MAEIHKPKGNRSFLANYLNFDILKMKTLKNYTIIFLAFGLICITTAIGTFLYGKYEKSKPDVTEETKIDSTVILDKIADNLFLVTKTAYLNQEVTITISSESKWNNLLWGQEINARGLIRNDIGIDVSLLDEEDITINHESKTIQITLPEATILDSSLFGELKIESKKGVFKNIEDFFRSDKSQDYNLAVEELLAKAQEAINQDQQLLEEAKDDSQTFIKYLLEETGYSVIISSKENQLV